MEKKKIIIYSVLFVGLFACLVGCSNGEVTSIDYNNFSYKIWVQEEKTTEYNTSFTITYISDDYIEGQYLINSSSIFNPRENWKQNFAGNMLDGGFQCTLRDGDKNVGSMILQLREDGKIEGIIEYNKLESKFNEKQIFRPYRLEDIEDFLWNDELMVYIDMNNRGKLKIVSGIININKMYPKAFIVNDSNEILYEFEAFFKNGTNIEKVIVQDFDGDNLPDVNIVTYFLDDEIEPIQWIFYQVEGNLFHLEDTIQSKIIYDK